MVADTSFATTNSVFRELAKNRLTPIEGQTGDFGVIAYYEKVIKVKADVAAYLN